MKASVFWLRLSSFPKRAPTLSETRPLFEDGRFGPDFLEHR
jgi:hypothetical protein